MRYCCALIGLLLGMNVGGAALPPIAGFTVDAASVQRYGPAWRYPQAGWIVLHIEGKPYERGYQHGRLLAPEIAGYVRCFAAQQSSKSPSDGWKATRTIASSLFVRRFDPEYQQEMQGIADGAAAAGAKFDGRPLDLIDIVAVNVWAEIDTLDSALEATPVGLEGIRFPKPRPKAVPNVPMEHCSAFAATGPATADGKIVFGHITMFGLYPSGFYNVWLDVKPEKGHRMVMQSYPGGIQSGMDYYINDGGLVVCETTIHQTKFNVEGSALSSRIRKAMQYSDSIDKCVEILSEKNNGLYANEWLIADMKTNEIAMFELGTAKSKLWRSSKNEWFGGTPGFYWGCNNAKDLEVRLETIASVEGRPQNLVWSPSDRDKTWLRFYNTHKGKIDAESGRIAFTTPPLVAIASLDAKITTSALAKDLKSIALFGPPLGKTWLPSDLEKREYPEIKPLVSNPWTLLNVIESPPDAKRIRIADLFEKVQPWLSVEEQYTTEMQPPTTPAWHGTILPKSDADIWLATAFAEYEKIVALENAFLEESETNTLSAEQQRYLTVLLNEHRCEALRGILRPKPLASDLLLRDGWIRSETGKGVMRLSLLRKVLGSPKFDELMDTFGSKYAGKEVSIVDFQIHFEKGSKTNLTEWLSMWESSNQVPQLVVDEPFATPTSSSPKNSDECCVGNLSIRIAGKSTTTLKPGKVSLSIDHGNQSYDYYTNRDGSYRLPLNSKPAKMVVGKYDPQYWNDGTHVTISTFLQNQDECVIVYGTLNDEAANYETAVRLQEGIRKRRSNITVPIFADRAITKDFMKNRHLLLVGSPTTNLVSKKYTDSFNVQFASGSFQVDGVRYANSESSVIVAANHPEHSQYAMVMLAGLSSQSTYSLPGFLLQKNLHAAEVLVIPYRGVAKSIALPPKRYTVDSTTMSKPLPMVPMKP